MIVRAFAPAKLILFGEHFVVYGADALAAAIDRYVTVEVSDYEKGALAIVSEDIPFLGVELEVRGNRISASYDAEESLIYVRKVLEHLTGKYDIPKSGFRIRIKSDVPISAGLGSSAATCVATIAALKAYFGIESDIDETRKDAREVERAVQGAASPIDTAVSSYGGFIHVSGEDVLRIRSDSDCSGTGDEIGGKGGKEKRKEERRNEEEISMMIAISHAFRASALRLKTKNIIERVRERKERFPSVFSYLLNAASEITRAGVEALRENDIKTLGTLFFINHGLLESIGVVTKNLSAFVSAARRAGATGAKVTGAGGLDETDVGSVLVLSPAEKRACIEGALIAEGAEVMHVRAGVSGLRVEVEE